MGNFLDKSGLTRFKEKLLDEVDSRISNSSGGDSPTKEEIIEGATRVTDVEVNSEVATVERLQTAVATVESNLDVIKANINGKLDASALHIVDYWSNGAIWYRKWSDGWVEQGGSISFNNDSHSNTVTFPIAFSNTNYTLTFGIIGTSTIGLTFGMAGAKSITNTGYVLWANSAYIVKSWYACGY